jgi:single-strand selective monofunctional uracil DNA glycosylase
MSKATEAALAAADQLTKDVDALRFGPPVTHVYNPLTYAWAPHAMYIRKYARAGCEAILVGMNPGPWGMAQTGAPFGDTRMVRDFLGIGARVMAPANEHPKRPILGFDCPRSEVSGTRFWGWARDTFRSADAFFETFFVANYCPLAFMEASGRNRTPDKLPAEEKKPLFDACDRALAATVAALRPRCVIGIGAFAEGRIKSAMGEDSGLTIGRILHPSPASPAANRDWAGTVTEQLREMRAL